MKRWLLLIDLDKTLWDHEDISMTRLPYTRLGPYLLVDRDGEKINAREYMIDFLKWAKSHGALVAALSQNEPELAIQALRALELTGLFDYYAIEYHPRKDLMFLNLSRRIQEHGLYHVFRCVVYIDDSKQQLDRVSAIVDSCCLQPGFDFTDYSSLVRRVSICLIKCGILDLLVLE